MSDITVTERPDGIVLRERTRGAVPMSDFMATDDKTRDHISERLFICPNGWSLGARRGGRLHLADADTWEVFTLTPLGIKCGESGGFVGEEQLERLVTRLAEWFEEAS